MKSTNQMIIVLTAILGISLPVMAAPFVVDYDMVLADSYEDFEAEQTRTWLPNIYTFDGFSIGDGVFYHDRQWQIAEKEGWCGEIDDRCLVEGWYYETPRILTPIDQESRFVGFWLGQSGTASEETFEIFVLGKSGSLTFTTSTSNLGYFAFGDTLGIESITIINRGHDRGGSNYGLDDVIVGRNLKTVPEPATIAILLLGLFAFGCRALHHTRMLRRRGLRTVG